MRSFHPDEVCSGQTLLKAVGLVVQCAVCSVMKANAFYEMQMIEMSEIFASGVHSHSRNDGCSRGKGGQKKPVGNLNSYSRGCMAAWYFYADDQQLPPSNAPKVKN